MIIQIHPLYCWKHNVSVKSSFANEGLFSSIPTILWKQQQKPQQEGMANICIWLRGALDIRDYEQIVFADVDGHPCANGVTWGERRKQLLSLFFYLSFYFLIWDVGKRARFLLGDVTSTSCILVCNGTHSLHIHLSDHQSNAPSTR